MAAYQTGSLDMPRARQGQIMAIGSALSIGLGLVLGYLLEWSIGVVFDTLSSRLSEISFSAWISVSKPMSETKCQYLTNLMSFAILF